MRFRRLLLLTPLLLLAAAIVWLVLQRRLDPERRGVDVVTVNGAPVAEAPSSPGEDIDREIFLEKVRWAQATGLDTLPIGEMMARIGESFVGTKYSAGTLEVGDSEHLVINLRELDCVTFVENVLALARVLRARTPTFEAFRDQLRLIRYRGGELDGYPSRLHYFSDWIRDGEGKGILDDVTAELGGVRGTEPIDFMSTHTDAYPRLSDPEAVRAIRETEARLTATPRFYIPEARIGAIERRIRDGDIIAATSTVPGLDIAHTGLAVWRNGRLHLMHAPLVGTVVEISEKPLAERILDIEAQDGIMVARPV